MWHVRNLHAVEYAIGSVRDGLIEAVFGNTNGRRTDVELADVYGVQG